MENITTTRADLSALTPGHIGQIVASDIPVEHLAIALANAALDPDGQVYPWLPGYPLAGATVVHDDRLWIVIGKERGPGQDEDTAIVHLSGEGHEGGALATRGELRPVTWTAGDEIALEIARSEVA